MTGWIESNRPGAPLGELGVVREPRERPAARRAAGLVMVSAILTAIITGAVFTGDLLQSDWRAAVHALDYAAALWVRSLRCVPMDAAMRLLGAMGERGPMALICAAIVLALYFRGRRFAALAAVVVMPGTAIMWRVTAALVQRPRPDFWMVHDPADVGFPGGHVINATVITGICLAATLPRLAARWQQAAAVALGALFVVGTFMSRIYESAHFFTDNLAGLAMGALWITLALPVVRWTFPGWPDRRTG
jgi:membrane-associated phospholipid phosphatase